MAVGWHHPTVEIDRRKQREAGGNKGKVEEMFKSESSIAQRLTVGNDK